MKNAPIKRDFAQVRQAIDQLALCQVRLAQQGKIGFQFQWNGWEQQHTNRVRMTGAAGCWPAAPIFAQNALGMDSQVNA